MISCKLVNNFGDTVPEMSEFDFDLGTMDTFEDLDINIDNMDMITDTIRDPFGDFSLEQSFNLIELNKFVCSDNNESLLEDIDGREDIMKQDIMWSSCHTINNFTSRGSCSRLQSTPSKLSLTPPTSYINQIFGAASPLSSSDDEAGSSCQPSPAPAGHSNDHCYSSTLSPSNNSLLTPPESSEDEDSSFSSLTSSPPASKSRSKACLTLIANDRLNQGVQSVLRGEPQKRKSSNKNSKFRFSMRMPRKSRIAQVREARTNHVKKEQKSAKITYQSLKENNQTIFPNNTGQTIKISAVQDKNSAFKGEKLSNREARDVHNQMERQRRSELNRAYAKLKDFVPSIANSDRTSKQMVLDKAIEHCQLLKSREDTAREQKRNLQLRNQALRRKLQQLESQVSPGQWEVQGW